MYFKSKFVKIHRYLKNYFKHTYWLWKLLNKEWIYHQLKNLYVCLRLKNFLNRKVFLLNHKGNLLVSLICQIICEETYLSKDRFLGTNFTNLKMIQIFHSTFHSLNFHLSRKVNKTKYRIKKGTLLNQKILFDKSYHLIRLRKLSKGDSLK